MIDIEKKRKIAEAAAAELQVLGVVDGNDRISFRALIQVDAHNRENDPASVLEMLDEIERLRGILRHTCKTYCGPEYRDRDLHAPECLEYEVDP